MILVKSKTCYMIQRTSKWMLLVFLYKRFNDSFLRYQVLKWQRREIKKRKEREKERSKFPAPHFFFGSGPESEIAKRYKNDESLVFFFWFFTCQSGLGPSSILYFSHSKHTFFFFGPQPSPITLYSDSFDQSSPCRDSTLPLQQPCRPHHCLHLITHLHLPCHLRLLP
jgi:hypothetical protein